MSTELLILHDPDDGENALVPALVFGEGVVRIAITPIDGLGLFMVGVCEIHPNQQHEHKDFDRTHCVFGEEIASNLTLEGALSCARKAVSK